MTTAYQAAAAMMEAFGARSPHTGEWYEDNVEAAWINARRLVVLNPENEGWHVEVAMHIANRLYNLRQRVAAGASR